MKETKFDLEDPKLCSKLRSLVQNSNEVFSIEEEPAKGAMCALRGLVFEFMNPELDRLSPFFGIDFSETRSAFNIQCVESEEWGLGIKIERLNGLSFEARHLDLVHILNQESFSESELKRIVIFPLEVASRFKKLGIQLVIVRDWILQTALHDQGLAPLNYFICNESEQEMVIGATQAQLMKNYNLPFFGTHDIVDHLFGLNRINFESSQKMASKVLPTLLSLQQNRERAEAVELKMAYASGVLLDDLAQPKFYNSSKHFEALELLDEALKIKSSAVRNQFKSLNGHQIENWLSLVRNTAK